MICQIWRLMSPMISRFVLKYRLLYQDLRAQFVFFNGQWGRDLLSNLLIFLLRCGTRTPNKTRTHSWRFASLVCKPLHQLRWPKRDRFMYFEWEFGKGIIINTTGIEPSFQLPRRLHYQHIHINQMKQKYWEIKKKKKKKKRYEILRLEKTN